MSYFTFFFKTKYAEQNSIVYFIYSNAYQILPPVTGEQTEDGACWPVSQVSKLSRHFRPRLDPYLQYKAKLKMIQELVVDK